MFTITVTTYNRSRLLCRCLDSIKMQTFRDYEVLILDDCSTDDTQEVVKEYLKDERFKYVRMEKNLGFGDKTFLWAQKNNLFNGDWVFIFSDDEYWSSQFLLEKANTLISRNKDINFIATDCGYDYDGIVIFERDSCKLLPESFKYDNLNFEDQLICDKKIKVIYRKDFLLKYDFFNPDIRSHRDVCNEVPYLDIYSKANIGYIDGCPHIFGVSPGARTKYLDFYNWIVSCGMSMSYVTNKEDFYDRLKQLYTDTSMCLNAFFDWGGDALARVLSYFVLDNDFPRYLRDFASIYRDKFQEDLYRQYSLFNNLLMSKKERDEALSASKNIVIYGNNTYCKQLCGWLESLNKNILYVADDGDNNCKNCGDIIRDDEVDLVFISSASPRVISEMINKIQCKRKIKIATLLLRDDSYIARF